MQAFTLILPWCHPGKNTETENRKALVINSSNRWHWKNRGHPFWDSRQEIHLHPLGKVMPAYFMLTLTQADNTVLSSSFVNMPHCKVDNHANFSKERAVAQGRRWFSKLTCFVLHLKFENWISGAQRMLFLLAKLRITYIIKPVSQTGIWGHQEIKLFSAV